MNIKDLLNIGYGILNPLKDTLIGKNFDSSNVKPLDAVIKSTEDSYAANSSLGFGPYLGICLRVDGYLNEGTSDPSNPFTVANESIRKNSQSDAPRLIQVKVRIPEIHSALPVPQTLPSPTEESVDHAVINLYPTFIAKDIAISSDVPQAGDMVWVHFRNSNTMDGPIYLGRVANDTLVNGNSTTSGRNSFAMSCTQVPAVAPPKTQPANASNSATAADPLAMVSQAKDAYTPKPKTPPAQNSIMVCGPVGANIAGNPNYLGIPEDYQPSEVADYPKSDSRYLGVLSMNGNTGKRKKKIEMIILHDGSGMAGATVEKVITMWSKKTVSSHYFIDLDGTVFQLESESRKAYHAGGGPVPDVNGRSIGVDLQRCREKGSKHKFKDKDGKKYDCDSRGYRRPYSKEQMASLMDLLKNITSRRGIPYDEQHIVAHGAIYAGNHSDPVKPFEWSEINLTNKYINSRGRYTQAPNPSSAGVA
tara:strand:- start:33428 stop:34855 length:1428 start_codon:yes stop_codon:yes gene_type:complete